jgi:uncharacterized membrane protein YgdD (TMEM256/DUF423 family)
MHHRDKIHGLLLSLLGAFTVALGAWGAHGLQNAITPEEYKRFEIGFFYQVFHLLVLITTWASHKISSRIKPWIFRLMGLGIVCFSGSLYLLSAASLLTFDFKFIGLLTPIGGGLLILGWFALGWGVLKKSR